MLVKEIIIEQLQKFGVSNIYNYPGDTTLTFISALKDSPINLYSTKHEGAAGLMASAESKMTGNISVCLSHGGPGIANILNGIADAASDRTPMLLISGQVESFNMGTNYKQFVNQIELSNPLTVYSSAVINPEMIVDLLYKAMVMAIIRGGVSHLIIPMDIWDRETSAFPREYPEHLNIKQRPDDNLIEQAAGQINEAQRPVIIYGRGCKKYGNNLKQISNSIMAPLIGTLPAAGIIGYDFPYEMGILGHSGNQYASELLSASDLIIILAATWWPVDYTPRDSNIIQFDLIPENIGSSHPVCLGIPGDIGISLERLSGRLNNKYNQQWRDQINQVKSKWLEEVNRGYSDEAWPLPPSHIIKIISENSGENEIITLDSGDNVIYFGKFFGNRCRDVVISGSWRTMGFALPAALSAKINFPYSTVISLIGDGGIGMVMAELLTAKRYQLPVVIIVMNNGNLAMERNRMITAGLELQEVDVTNPDFVKIAEACGIKGYSIDTPDKFRDILGQAKSQNQAVLIDVPVASPVIPGTKLMKNTLEY